MRSIRLILLAVFVIVSPRLFAQAEKPGFFSLSSSRTYAPGQKVSIDMWAQNVETLEFRVYRVNDPVKLALLNKKEIIENQIDALKYQKELLAPEDYRRHIEDHTCPTGTCTPLRARRYETMAQP